MAVRIRPIRPKDGSTQAVKSTSTKNESYLITVPVGTIINIEYED